MTCLACVVREIEIVLFVAGLVLCLRCQGGRPRVLGEVIGVGLGELEGRRGGGEEAELWNTGNGREVGSWGERPGGH